MMRVLVCESIDKAGKATQCRLLAQALREKGLRVEQGEFHNYESPTGQLIRKFLDGEYKVSQQTIECIMAADKFAQAEWIESLRETTDVLILDRYVMSQLAYSVCLGMDADWVIGMLSGLPLPDFHIMPDIPVEVSMSRKGQHGDNDLYESNKELLSNARNLFFMNMRGLEQSGEAIIVDGTKSIEEVHQDILSGVLSYLEKEGVLSEQ